MPETAGRLNDTAPYYGGGGIVNNSTGQSCTSGFAVTNSWGSYLVTAGHCGWPTVVFSNGNWSQRVGTASEEHVSYDLLLIPASSYGYVFNNRWGHTDTITKVNGWVHPYHNEYMCTSGSYTGEVCGVQVDTSNAYSYCSAGECHVGMYRAYQRAGLRAVQAGDSGGPVYNYNRSATGIISGQSNNGRTVIFQDFHTVNQV